MDKKYITIPKDKFEFVSVDQKHDLKLDTKPISYFHDAFNRFKKNKASVVASVIILCLFLFAIVVPIFSPYSVSYRDSYFKYALPKNPISEALGWNFWDGCSKEKNTEQTFLYYYSMGAETGHNAVKNQKYTIKTEDDKESYIFRLDSYYVVGVVFKNVSKEQYESLKNYQNETGIQVIYPMTDPKLRPVATHNKNDGNYWFRTSNEKKNKTIADLDENGNFVNIYMPYTGSDDYDSKRVEDGKLYDYARENQSGYEIRINYYEYYIYEHTYLLKDGIKSPVFIFGTTDTGQDILTCLASGALFSFMLAICVCAVNFTVGAIYGAIEGYYGGVPDLIMERISDILSAVPFMIVITLLKLHMGKSSNLWALLIAFFITGWIGMASSVRMQFYRFKNQEYVLAARTLGASDRRIMFKHIFPNSLGTLITGSVLAIPSVIFSESSLSYLGIINLSTGNLTSVGTLLAKAQPYLTNYPHMIFFPAVFISLLMLSFNLFGNGLRDAFNPSLRGSED